VAPIATLTVTTPLPVPEAGFTVSHDALSLALQLRVPPPVLLMFTVWLAGLAAPCVAAKARLVGLAPMAGGTGGGGATGGGGTGSGTPMGVKVTGKLSIDSLLEKSYAVRT
jgi:hypothetical protein